MNRLFYKIRAAVLREALEISGFMRLLTKRRNTGERWTREEKARIKGHLRSLARTAPLLLVFSLPGGSLLLPLLALALDRRNKRRLSRRRSEKSRMRRLRTCPRSPRSNPAPGI